MKLPTICLLHPGAMGSGFGAVAVAAGYRVLWVSTGRSEATRVRAAAANLEEASSLADALAQSDIVLSICPPHNAEELAAQVMTHAFKGLYCDANAISPQTAKAIAEQVNGGGARFVDGGIIGPPPRNGATLRLCLAGPDAGHIAGIYTGTAVEPVLLGDRVGAASAMKICYAAWSKGTTALLESICAVAQQEAVLEPLIDEWRKSQPDVEKRIAQIPATAGKSWRWRGEMEQVAQLFEASGLPGGFHQSAAEVFGRLDVYKEMPRVELAEILATLSARQD